MSLLKPNKPSILSRLINQNKQQPSTMPSRGERDIAPEEALGTEPASAAPRGTFAARRSRTPVAEPEFTEVPSAPRAAPVASTDATPPANSAPFAPPVTPASFVPPVPPTPPMPPAPPPESGMSDETPEPERVRMPEPSRASKLFKTVKKAPADDAPATFVPKKSVFATAALAGLAARLKTKSKPAAGVPKEKSVPAPTQKRAAVPKGPVKQITLLTELDNGRQLFWNLTTTSLQQLPGTPELPAVLSFSKDDVRIYSDTVLTYAKADEVATVDIGEDVVVVNKTKELNTLYCTRADRAMTALFRIAPGQQALDALLKATDRTGRAFVTGFLVRDEAAATSVAILYYVSAEGESSKPQVTLNPDNMDFLLAQFMATRKADKKTTEVHFFDNADLLSVAGDFRYFPNEKVWNGVPIRVLQRGGAVLTGVIAAASVAFTAVNYTQQKLLDSDIRTMKENASDLNKKTNQRIGESIYSFSQNVSQDQERMFAVAEQVWSPGAKLLAEMKGQDTKVTVNFPLSTNRQFQNKVSVYSAVSPEAVAKITGMVAPEGCQKNKPQTTGSLNEIRIDIVCQTFDSPFSRYSSD